MSEPPITSRLKLQPEFPDAVGFCCVECGNRLAHEQRGVMVGARLYCEPCWNTRKEAP